MNVILFSAFFFLYTGLSCEQTVSFVWIYVGCMCLFIEYLKCIMKICGCQWHMFAIVQWLNSLWRRNSSNAVTCVYALVPLLTEGGECEIEMYLKNSHECVKTWCMLQIEWFTLWWMMRVSTKKWSACLEWHVILSPNKRAGTVLLANRVMEVCRLHIGWFLG